MLSLNVTCTQLNVVQVALALQEAFRLNNCNFPNTCWKQFLHTGDWSTQSLDIGTKTITL